MGKLGTVLAGAAVAAIALGVIGAIMDKDEDSSASPRGTGSGGGSEGARRGGDAPSGRDGAHAGGGSARHERGIDFGSIPGSLEDDARRLAEIARSMA